MSSPPHPHDSSGPARRAVATGWARVTDAWWPVMSAYLLSLVLALPLAAAMQASLAGSLRHREAAQRLLEGWDGLWLHTFKARAGGIESTFDAGIVGIGAVLRSLDALLRGAILDLPAPLVLAGLLYLLGWVLLGGGLLARFGGDGRGLLRLGALHMRRMLALTMVGWVGFVLILGPVLGLLSGAVERICIDVIDERVFAAWLLAKYVVVWGLVLAVRAVVDYAKVAAIADPELSWPAALRVGLRICTRRTGAVVGVMILLGAIGLGLLLAYWMIAPGAEQANAFKILIAFIISQTSVVARVVMRAWSLATEQALFEHAE